MEVRRRQVHDAGEVAGVGLAVTDAVALADGRVLLSAAAEDTPNPVDDGPVVATALAVLVDGGVVDDVALPPVDGRVAEVEGLALLERTAGSARLLAVVDADDAELPPVELVLRVSGL